MITVENSHESLILTIHAKSLDAANAVVARQEFQKAIPAPGGAIVIDMGQVGFVDSTGVGVLLGVCKFNQRKVTLREARPEVLSVLKLLRLQKVFDFEGE